MHKLAARLTVSVALLALLTLPAAALRTDDQLIRVNLTYSGGPVAAVNALSDNGYDLGYFEGSHFAAVASLPNRYVAFCKDALLYTNGRSVSEASSDGTAIKPYHLEVARDFADQSEAERFVVQVRQTGYKGEIFPAYIDGAHRVRIEMYSKREFAAADIGNLSAFTQGEELRVVGAEPDTVTVIDLNTISIAYEISLSGALPAARALGGGTLKNSLYYYNGAFEFARANGNLVLRNVLPLREYLKGVLPYEMDGSWPLEALKAQALCARSYVLYNLGKHKDADICNTTHCQVYYGTTKETQSVRDAVEQTDSQVVTYEGKLIGTFYFASSGGYTESSENAWGGKGYPYYAAVPDPYEDPATVTAFHKQVSAAELTALVRELGADIGTVINCYVSKYTEPAGNVFEVTFVGSGGRTYVISRTDNVRIKLNSLVKSPRFDIYSGVSLFANTGEALSPGALYALDAAGNPIKLPAQPYIVSAGGVSQPASTPDGTFVFAGAGFGHNVGMSQQGARGMALAGFSAQDIIHHYFHAVDIRRSDEVG